MLLSEISLRESWILLLWSEGMSVVRKVLSLSQRDEPLLNIFVVATHYRYIKKSRKTFSDFSLYFCADETHTKIRVSNKSKNGQNRGLSSHKISAKERFDTEGNSWGHSTYTCRGILILCNCEVDFGIQAGKVWHRRWPSIKWLKTLSNWWTSWCCSLYGFGLQTFH